MHLVNDLDDVLPYTSYFQSNKASITFKTQVIYHDVTRMKPPLKIHETSWLNYVFEDDAGMTMAGPRLGGA